MGLNTRHPGGRPKGPVPTFVCECCGKTQERRLCRTKDGKHTSYDKSQRFCSKECGYLGRSWRPISDDGYAIASGYIRLSVRGGGKAYKHRRVMEEILGRPLGRGENVHHKDGDRANNAPENLELWAVRQPPGQRVSDQVKWAIELLRKYPELAEDQGVKIVSVYDADCDAPDECGVPMSQVNAPANLAEIK